MRVTLLTALAIFIGLYTLGAALIASHLVYYGATLAVHKALILYGFLGTAGSLGIIAISTKED